MRLLVMVTDDKEKLPTRLRQVANDIAECLKDEKTHGVTRIREGSSCSSSEGWEYLGVDESAYDLFDYFIAWKESREGED